MGADFQLDRREQILSVELLDAIRKKLQSDCIVTRCREKACSVDMRCSPEPFILIDVDKASTNQRGQRCDFIFVGGSDESWVVPIELKGSKADLDEVAEQLQAGARFAEQIIPSNVPVRFRPVLASKGIKKGPRGKVKKESKIRFHGNAILFERMKCGGRLAPVLKRRLEEER